MKKLIYTLGLATLVAFTANAQSKDKKESKKVEYTVKDDQAKLTITTEVNGEKKVEHYTGKEAEAKMKEMNNGGEKEVSKVVVQSGKKSKGFHYDIDIESDDEDGHSKSIVFINDNGEKKKININTSDEKIWVVKDGETIVDLNFEELEEDLENLGEELSEEIEAIIKKYDVDSKVEEQINGDGTKTITITKEITVPNEGGKSSKTKREETLDIEVYPNPSKDEMTVAWNSSKKTSASIKVTDLSGKTFIEKDMTVKGKHKETLDLKSLPKGTYLVQVQTGDETSTHKIMVD